MNYSKVRVCTYSGTKSNAFSLTALVVYYSQSLILAMQFSVTHYSVFCWLNRQKTLLQRTFIFVLLINDCFVIPLKFPPAAAAFPASWHSTTVFCTVTNPLARSHLLLLMSLSPHNVAAGWVAQKKNVTSISSTVKRIGRASHDQQSTYSAAVARAATVMT